MSTTRRKRPIVLTADWLDQQNACEDQAALAILYFGRRATVTRTMLHECAALGLDLDWLAQHILTRDPYHAFVRATVDPWRDFRFGRTDKGDFDRAISPALADALGLP